MRNTKLTGGQAAEKLTTGGIRAMRPGTSAVFATSAASRWLQSARVICARVAEEQNLRIDCRPVEGQDHIVTVWKGRRI